MKLSSRLDPPLASFLAFVFHASVFARIAVHNTATIGEHDRLSKGWSWRTTIRRGNEAGKPNRGNEDHMYEVKVKVEIE